MRPFLQGLYGLAVIATTLWAFLTPDTTRFQRPELARIFFWHFPCPILATFFLGLGAYLSIRVLRSAGDEGRTWDARAEAAQEIAGIFVALTLFTGIVFSRAQWLAWWQNDPRQTSFLFVSLIVLAYFVLRGAFSDPLARARNSAAYALMAIGPILFLTFVYPRLPQVQSFHPTDTIQDGQLHGQYWMIIILTTSLTAILATWCYRLRVRTSLLHLRISDVQHSDPRRDPADSPVVRPVPLSVADGS